MAKKRRVRNSRQATPATRSECNDTPVTLSQLSQMQRQQGFNEIDAIAADIKERFTTLQAKISSTRYI